MSEKVKVLSTKKDRKKPGGIYEVYIVERQWNPCVCTEGIYGCF